MKRKIFSKLLMVALVIAAVGSFVSCKDYDDDINNLQKQIDNAALKSSVEALQSTLDSKITAAQNAAAAAQTAADKAAATANAAVTKAQLDDAISAAKSAAATAANEYADKVAAAAQTAAAQKAYDDAKAYVDAEVAKVTAAIPSEAAIKAIADASAAALDEALATELKAWVNEQIDAIDVQGKVDAAVAKAIEKIDTAADNVAAIWSAVTSIEFVYALDEIANTTLNFQYGTEIANVFGDKTEVNAYAKADEKKTYVAGDSIKADNVYILRVSPVNANLEAADLKLMNSKGETLNDYVNIEVKPFTELLTTTTATRASENNGLWKVTVTLKDNFKIEELQKAVHAVIKKDGTQTSAAVYAFAANTDVNAAADRYAVTPYDLYPITGKYNPARTLNVKVNGKDISNYYNRWDSQKIVAEDGTIERDSAHFETVWKASTDEIPTPAVKGVWGENANIQKDGTNYTGKELLAVNLGEPIVINFDANQYPQIDRFYVLLDLNNAIESDPSESNIWIKYDIDGLGEMKKSSEKLRITINDSEAEGDILGFRVYATNYDGTLVDPDGRAFYVQVGEAKANDTKVYPSATSVATFKPVKADQAYAAKAVIKDGSNGVVIPVDFTDLGIDKSIKLSDAKFIKALTTTQSTAANKAKIAADPVVTITYLKSNELSAGEAQEATKIGEVKYIAINVKNPEKVIDGATFYTDAFQVVDPDKHNAKVAKIQFAIKKGTINVEDPNKANPFSWKTGYEPVGGIVKLYPGINAAAWNAAFPAATPLVVNLNDYVNNATQNIVNASEYSLSYEQNDDQNVSLWGTGAAGVWTYLPTASAAKTDSIRFDGATPSFTIEPAYVGAKPTKKPTINGAVTGRYTANFTIKTKTAEAISLTWKPGATDAEKTDAKVAANTVTSAPKYTVVNNQKIQFENILDYETYSIKETYLKGAKDEVPTVTANKLWLKYSELGTTAAGRKCFRWYSTSGTLDDSKAGYKPGDALYNHLYSASKERQWGAAVASLETILSQENSAIKSFGNATHMFSSTQYVSYDNFKIISPNGAINEYVQPGSAVLTDLNFQRGTSATAPTEDINMTLQFEATDAFGQVHVIKVPFLLGAE